MSRRGESRNDTPTIHVNREVVEGAAVPEGMPPVFFPWSDCDSCLLLKLYNRPAPKSFVEDQYNTSTAAPTPYSGLGGVEVPLSSFTSTPSNLDIYARCRQRSNAGRNIYGLEALSDKGNGRGQHVGRFLNKKRAY